MYIIHPYRFLEQGERSDLLTQISHRPLAGGGYIFMKNKITVLFAGLLVPAILVFPFARANGNTNKAAEYLSGKSQNPWAVMALAADGNSPSVEHLKNISASEAIDLEAPILALTAVGEDPRSFSDTDLVAALQGHLSGGQIGDPDILNDDIFGILALAASGVPDSDPSISASREFLLGNQNGDGGWSFAASSDSDTNTTAAAIMALLETGSSAGDAAIASAIAYLRGAQNADGGLPYDPHSPWGTDSDASSDAWTIMALNKAGIDPGSWTTSGGDPASNLLALQADEGYFRFQTGSSEDAFSPVTTSYALIALLGKSFPVGRISPPEEDPEPAVDGVAFRIEGSSAVICEGKNEADNALEVVRLAANTCGFTYEIEETAYGPYLKRIGEDAEAGAKGWLYAVNGESPSIGAADYELEDGDRVVWHYGSSDWDPSSDTDFRHSLDLTVNIVTSTAPVGEEISFSVEAGDSGEVDFGSMSAGATAKKMITIRNWGDAAISVSAEVSGDAVFRDHLYIDGGGWSLYGADLNGKSSEDSEISIFLPSDIQARGEKNGALIFWAVAK